MRESARNLGAVVGIGLAASIALGVALGYAQDESVLRWIAYALYIAGACVIGFAFLSSTPPSPRKLAKQRTLDRAQARVEGRNPDAGDPSPGADAPFVSELVVLVVAGTALFCAGVLLELAT
jgi:hypothetical protein